MLRTEGWERCCNISRNIDVGSACRCGTVKANTASRETALAVAGIRASLWGWQVPRTAEVATPSVAAPAWNTTMFCYNNPTLSLYPQSNNTAKCVFRLWSSELQHPVYCKVCVQTVIFRVTTPCILQSVCSECDLPSYNTLYIAKCVFRLWSSELQHPVYCKVCVQTVIFRVTTPCIYFIYVRLFYDYASISGKQHWLYK